MLLALPAYRNIRPSPPNVGRQSCTSYFCRLMVSFFAHQLLAGRGITTAVGLRTFVLFYELPGTRVYRFFPFLVFRLFFSLVFSSIFLESLSWIPTVSHHHTGDKIVHPPPPGRIFALVFPAKGVQARSVASMGRSQRYLLSKATGFVVDVVPPCFGYDRLGNSSHPGACVTSSVGKRYCFIPVVFFTSSTHFCFLL